MRQQPCAPKLSCHGVEATDPPGAPDAGLQTKDGVLTTLRKELGLTGEDHDDIKGLVMEDDYITALRSAGNRSSEG